MRAALSYHGAESSLGRQLVAWARVGGPSLMLMIGESERRERFGYALAQALIARNVSERQLALRLEVDPRQVAKWRSGKGLPDIYQTQAIAEYLRVSERLFREPPPVPKPPAYPIGDYLLEAIAEGARRGLSGIDPDDADGDEPDGPPQPRRPKGH